MYQDESCQNCQWFRRNKDSSDGRCFLNPPTVIPNEEQGWIQVRPEVYINDFCSSFAKHGPEYRMIP